MRYVNLYFVGYMVFMLGVVLALWKTGVLGSVSPIWILIGAIIALGLGLMMAIGSGKPEITRE
jgi:hypothetical protein